VKHPGLKIEKTRDAWSELDHEGRWRVPAEYRVTGPSGQVYEVQGSGYARMGRSEWGYSRISPEPAARHGFRSMRACLAAIAALESQPEPTPENTFTGASK
jgi:hypothetical protein